MSYSTFNKHASSSSGGTLRELSQKIGWRESLGRWTKVGLFVGVALGSTLPAAALATSIISGVKFNDLNGNGVQDAGEKGRPAEIIRFRNTTSGAESNTHTDMEGRYQITLPAGKYAIWTDVLVQTEGKLEEFWQTAPIKVEEIGVLEKYYQDLPNKTELSVNFGLWDGVKRQDCTLCVTANDQQTDAGEEVTVGGNVVDKAPDGSNLTITVEAFGYSAVKTVAATDRVANASIPIDLGMSFPKGGEYPIKITVTSDNRAQAEGTGKIVVRDVATSDACDVKVINAWSTRSGKWNDPVIWSAGRVPGPNDWVMVASGHTVQVPAITIEQVNKKEMLRVKGLCVDQGGKLGKFFYRKLTTPPPGLASTYQRKTRTGTRSVRAVVNDACDVTPTKTAKVLTPPGSWTDPNTWDPSGEPEPTDKVKIPANAGVVIPYTTTYEEENKVNRLCNEGVLMSPSDLPPDGKKYYLAINPTKLHNKGTIVSNDGALSGGPGVSIYISAGGSVTNDGTIQSGNGGAPAGSGGGITIDTGVFTNGDNGKIQLGSGASCDAGFIIDRPNYCYNGGRAGDGGALSIIASLEPEVKGQVIAGNGGNATHDGGTNRAGIASNISINGNGSNKYAAVIDGKNGRSWYDPIYLELGVNTNIHSGDISFVSDDNGKIEVGNLSEGAITAERTLTWAIGKGGIIDFSQVSNKAFKAGQEMIIYTDNLILPAGKTLAQLVDAPKVTLLPAKLLMNAGWFTTEETMIGSPDEQLLLPLTLNNLGPAKDTYTLTVTNPQGWSMCNLPKTVTVNSQRNVKLECHVTLPATRGAENTVIITAASQTDPALQVTTTLHLQVAVEQYDLYGKVVDNNSQPVKGATVQVGDKTTTTDDQGQWMVMDLPVGDYNITTSKEGYVFSSQPVTVNGQTTLMTISGNSQSTTVTPVDNGITMFNSAYTLVATPSPTPGPETEMQVVDNGDGSYTGTNGVMVVDLKPTGNGNSEELTIVTGKEVTGTGESSSVKVTTNPDGSYSLTDEKFPSTMMTLHGDGTTTVTDTATPNIAATLNDDGSLSVTNEESPGTVFTANADGTSSVTSTTFPGLTATLNPEGKTVVTDIAMPSIEIAFDQAGQATVTDLASGMSAVRNENGTYTVSDPLVPEVLAIVNPSDSSAQLIDSQTGQCLTAETSNTKRTTRGFFSKGGFLDKATSFVGKVAGVVNTAANFVGKVASAVNTGANWIVSKAPVVNTIATTIQKWAANKANAAPTGSFCNCFFGAIANWASKVVGITTASSPFLGFVTKVANISNTVMNVAGTVSKVATGVTKVVSGIRNFFGWMVKPFSFRSVRADTSPNCPIVTPDEGPYTASGTIKDKLGPVAGVTVQIAGKSATTDAAGNWEITGLTAGNYTAEANKDGYLSLIQQFDVSEAMPTAKVPLKLASLLKVGVSTQPKVAKAGDNVTYLVSVTNNGTRPATNLVLKDVIPAGTSLISLDGANCDTHTVSCTISELAAGQTAKVKLIVNAPQAGKLENTATVTATDYPAEVNVSTKEVVPTLSVLTQCTPNPVPMLESLHCIATVNLGPTATEAATGVTVVTTLPTGVALQAATTTFGTCNTSKLPTVTCQLNDLSSGNNATINLDLALKDAGLLVLTQETTVSASNYGSHSAKTRTNIFIPAEIQVDLALVIDITGSMQGEIDGAKAALKKFIATLDSNTSPLIALIVFKDEVTVKAFTQDMTVLLKAIDSLKAEGGGTCPEASVEAVEVGALHVKPGGQIWFSTDASPYADADVQSVLDLLQSKNIRFNATVTGDCTSGDSANDNGFAQAVNQ